MAGTVGLLGALIPGGELAGWPLLRQPLERAMSRGANVPVLLQGAVKLHLVGQPRLQVERLRIASDARFKVPHLLDAQHTTLAWRWSDVWRWYRGGTLHLQALRADVLDAHLVRTADGTANWQLGANRSLPDTGAANPALPSFGELTVGQGKINWRDALEDADLAISLRGSEGSAAGESGTASASGYAASIQGRYRAWPLKLDVRAGSTLPLLQDPDTASRAPWVPVRIAGTVAATRVLFDGQAAALLGAPRWQGTVEVAGPSLADVAKPLGMTLPRTPAFDVRGQLQQDAGVWRFQTTRAHVGSSRLKGDLQLQQRTQPPLLTGTITGPLLALADLGPAISGERGAPEESANKPDKRALPQGRFDLPSLKAMDADVQMDIQSLDFGTQAMAPLRQLKTRLLLNAGVLRLESLQAVVSGGQIRGMTALDSNANPAKWEARLSFEGIDMAGWIRALRADSAQGKASPATATAALSRDRKEARQGGDQSVQAYLTGQLSGNLHLRGAGRSTAEILGSADGPLNIALREGTLSHLVTEAMGIDVAEALAVMITGDRPLPLRCARLDLIARNGVIQPRRAVLDNQDSTMWITGQVNLRDESLNLRVVTQPKDWSPLSLRTPVTITGTLASPAVGIESQGLAGRLLGALALGAVAGPAAAVLPLMETGSTDDQDPCRQTAAAGPAPQAASPARK